MFTVGVCLILLFRFSFLWLQNGTLTINKSIDFFFFFKKIEHSGVEFFFRQMKIFRIFISKERSFPQNIPFLENLTCQEGA